MRTLVAVVVVLIATTNAYALDHKCTGGQVWSPSQRACVKPRPIPPQSKYKEAVAELDSTAKATQEHGVALLDSACTGNHAAACTLLGYLNARGRIVKQDQKKAMELYTKGCNLGDQEGCFNIGDLAYSLGDAKRAREAFVHSCDQSNGIACARAADLIEGGTGGPADPGTATPMFKKSLDLLVKQCPGDGYACWVVGYLYEHAKGTEKNLSKATTAYRNGCDASSALACNALGVGLENGSLTGTPDADGAIKAFEKACESDDAEACQKYAIRAGNKGQNVEHAFELAQHACQLENKYCMTVGEFYRLGVAVKKDDTEANSQYRVACVSGTGAACTLYAKRAHDGIGMTADLDEAIAGATLGCTNDDGEGCGLAARYLQPKDPAKATEMAKKGCDMGDGSSCYVAGSFIEANDSAGALVFYKKGCPEENAASVACTAASHIYEPTDKAEAKRYAIRGCNAGTTIEAGASCMDLVRYDYFADPKNVDEALLAASYACAYGQDEPCGWVGQLSNESKSDKTDIRNYLAGQCTGGTDGACYAQALVLLSGGDADKRAALVVMDAACGRNHANSCILRADAYANGWGTMKNNDKAKQIYASFCDKGNANACLNVAVIANQTGDYPTAVAASERACEAGSPGGCTELGYFYFTAKGVGWDSAKGVTYWQKGCGLGEPIGCGNEGYMHMLGAGGAVDAKKANELYVKSCQPTNEFWCWGVAHYAETGEGGVKKDLKVAEDNYRLSCMSTSGQAYALACADLARLLEQQHKGSPAEIQHLREKAISIAKDRGDDPIQAFAMGTFYRDGVVAAKDPAKALEWFSKSCEGYDPQACVASGELLLKSSNQADRDKGNIQLKRACSTGYSETTKVGYDYACNLLKGPHGPKPVGPQAKTGCCQGTPEGGTGAILLSLLVVVAGARRSRAGSSRGRARA